MKSAGVLAWLTCLFLAFFACLLAVRNAYTTVQLDRRMTQMQRALDERGRFEELQRIRLSLANVERELSDLQGSEPAGASAELARKLAELQELLSALQAELDNLAQQKGH